MLSANLSNTRNVLREKTLNYINAPLNEYMNSKKSSLPDDSQYKTFQRNLQLQKQILNDQEEVHNYQTELFTKSVKQERIPLIINRPSVQHFRPTLTNDYALPQKKEDHLVKQITRIDNDLEQLADIYYQRKLLSRSFNKLEENILLKKNQIAQENHKLTIYKAFFQQLQKKQIITKFKQSLKI